MILAPVGVRITSSSMRAADTPSVLLETGYMSNEEDSKFLFSESGQRLIARGVRQAVEAHFKPRIASR